MPNLDWGHVWRLARIQGITNEARTFWFRLLNNLLNRILPSVTSNLCMLCNQQAEDDIRLHTFTKCTQSNEAMSWLVSVISLMDPNITPEKIISLQIEPTNETNELACVWLISESLQYIWAKRKMKAAIDIQDFVSKMQAKCYYLSKSKFSQHATNFLALIETVQNP